MSADTGGAAFPSHDPQGMERWAGLNPASRHEDGMTLLDHFAGLSMQAHRHENLDAKAEDVSKWAYDDAAAMLTERARRTDGK